jgi:hypothetical protein
LFRPEFFPGGEILLAGSEEVRIVTVRKKADDIIKPAEPAGETTRRKARAAASASNGFQWTLISITDAIRESAYYLWENEGRPEGRDFELWLRAEKEFLSRIIKKTA